MPLQFALYRGSDFVITEQLTRLSCHCPAVFLVTLRATNEELVMKRYAHRDVAFRAKMAFLQEIHLRSVSITS